MTEEHKKTIAVDFDGVIHAHVSPWTDSHEINDGPIPGALDFLRSALDAGFGVIIHTARANTASTVPHVHAWLRKHGLEERYAWQIGVTALKPAAVLYLDDHGMRFEGRFPTVEELRALRRWRLDDERVPGPGDEKVDYNTVLTVHAKDGTERDVAVCASDDPETIGRNVVDAIHGRRLFQLSTRVGWR